MLTTCCESLRWEVLVEGTPFGRYRLVDLLGRGGMGEVWRAYDTGTGRVVALKVLPAHFAQDPTFDQRFRREAHAAAGLHNPHIVPIHDYGEIDGRLFVDMVLIDGHDLSAEIARGPIEPARAVTIVEQIAKALHAAHRAGLVHRDVKPSNILLDEDDNAYLIDFGIARAAADTSLTGTGLTIGTWAYMAPERFTSDQIDPRGDVYALACVLHECLTGTTPYPGPSLERQFAGHVHTAPPVPSSLRTGVPQTFDAVIAVGMAKDSKQRYSTTKEFAAAARAAVTAPIERPAPATPTSLPTPPANRHTSRAPRPQPVHSSGPADAAGPTSAASPLTPAQDVPPPGRPTQARFSPDRTTGTNRRNRIFIAAAVLAVVAVVAVVATIAIAATRGDGTKYGAQITLPFAELSGPRELAIDTAGTLYVSSIDNSRVLRLAAGAGTSTEVPFPGLTSPYGVAVDTAGSIYVTAQNTPLTIEDRLLKLPANSTTSSQLPVTGGLAGVKVDKTDNVFVVDSQPRGRVLKLAAGTGTPTELPFGGLNNPQGVAVDNIGNVYVTEWGTGHGRVVKLPAGATTPTELPFSGLNSPEGVAVDNTGAVYVTDKANDRVLKLPVGATSAVELPFVGLDSPTGIAADAAGNVYVVDLTNNRVLKLPVV